MSFFLLLGVRLLTGVIKVGICHPQATDVLGGGANATGTPGGVWPPSGSMVSMVGSTLTSAVGGVTVVTPRRRSGEGGVDFPREPSVLPTTKPRQRSPTVDFCKSRVKVSLQADVSSTIPCICELNLADMAHNVSNNGANAADCKQRRKCLKLGKIFLHDRDEYFYLLECFH